MTWALTRASALASVGQLRRPGLLGAAEQIALIGPRARGRVEPPPNRLGPLGALD
jgi:hypothetical protein